MSQLKPNQHPTLLLVTDSPVTRVFFEAAVLKLENHALVCSNSEKETLDVLKQTFISFIVIDENTPHIDLVSLCSAIRQANGHLHTPLLVITSHLKKSFTRQLLKAGVTDFLREPIEEEDFFHRMEMAEEIVQTKQKMQSLQSHFSNISPSSASLDKRIVVDDQVMRLISDALKDDRSLALLLIAIDSFDHFEKARGENATETFLNAFHDSLKTLMRGQDLLLMQAKGQCLVLLPDTTSKAAQFIAENLQEALANRPFLSGKMRVTVTTSIGIVTLDQEGLKEKSAAFNFDRLMQKASACLEKAKQKGNTIISHH